MARTHAFQTSEPATVADHSANIDPLLTGESCYHQQNLFNNLKTGVTPH